MFLVCGEALFDFFLETEEGPASASYAARAGGSPFNVAVGLARLGIETGLLTGLSDDLLGSRLAQVLAQEGVSTRYCVPSHRPTTISLVGLDTQGVPAYQFYGQGGADTSLDAEELPALGPEVGGLHFGSYSLAVTPVAEAFARLAEAERGRFISLDPNVRASIEPDLDLWRARIGHLLPRARLVKISTEDLALLYPGTAPEAFAADALAGGARLAVVTDGGEAVEGWTARGHHARAAPPAVSVVDTVGAGDTFQAALIARLSRGAAADDPAAAIEALDAAALERLLDYAARAAAFTCARRGADLPRAGDVAD